MTPRRSTTIFAASVFIFFAFHLIYHGISISPAAGLFIALFLTIPAAGIGWFALSLTLYLKAKKQGSEDVQSLYARFLASISILVFLAVVFGALFLFFMMAISHM